MDLLYRALGVAAAVNNTLGRHSLNFIPSNILIGALAAGVLIFNVSGWLEAVEAGTEPQVVQLAELATGRTGPSSYVRTSGLLVVDAGFHYGEQDDNGNMKRVTMEFVPLVDRETRRGLFVQLPAAHRFGSVPQELELTGMLRPMKEFLARELRGADFEYEGVQMLPGMIMVADDTPGERASWQIGTVASGGLLGLLLLLTIKRNVIFRRLGDARHSGVAPSAAGPTGIRATGTFHLDKHTRRFIEVPAVLGAAENGDLAALANVDASSNVMGVTYAKREGIWAMPIARGSVQQVEEGLMYYGTRAWPALRFKYRDAASSQARTAILSVLTPADRQSLFAHLRTLGAGV